MINWRASSSGSPRSLQSADFSSCSWRSRLVDDALPGSRDLCSCGRQAIVDDAVPRIRDLHSSPTRNPTSSIRTCLTNQAMARRLAVSPSVGRTLAWQRATWRAEENELSARQTGSSAPRRRCASLTSGTRSCVNTAPETRPGTTEEGLHLLARYPTSRAHVGPGSLLRHPFGQRVRGRGQPVAPSADPARLPHTNEHCVVRLRRRPGDRDLRDPGPRAERRGADRRGATRGRRPAPLRVRRQLWLLGALRLRGLGRLCKRSTSRA